MIGPCGEGRGNGRAGRSAGRPYCTAGDRSLRVCDPQRVSHRPASSGGLCSTSARWGRGVLIITALAVGLGLALALGTLPGRVVAFSSPQAHTPDTPLSAPSQVHPASIAGFFGYPRFGALFTFDLAWADYDNDGDRDLAVGNAPLDGDLVQGQNYLCINGGASVSYTFTCTSTFGLSRTLDIAWGDFDDDGDLDLAVGNEGQNYLYVNIGDAFSRTTCFGAGNTGALAWGDFDNDGDLDLAVGNYGETITDGQNFLFVNQGLVDTCDFSPAAAFGFTHTAALAWADYDNDGDLDLAIGNTEGEQNYLCVNGGAAAGYTFTCTEAFGQGYTTALAWADYDGDGDSDLAVGNDNGQPNYLCINQGPPDYTFDCQLEFGSGSTTDLAWADYDGDGDLDLAVGNHFQESLSVWIPAGIYIQDSGVFSRFYSLQRGDVLALAWADYDADGDMDLAVGTTAQNYLFVQGVEVYSTYLPMITKSH